MIDRRDFAEEWFDRLSDKSLQVDVVLTDAAGPQSLRCARSFRDYLIDTGFANVVVRRESRARYGGGLPPR
ncbi:MAG: hypothetical protein ABIQ46_00950 [Alteraurantiacibacter sp.]